MIFRMTLLKKVLAKIFKIPTSVTYVIEPESVKQVEALNAALKRQLGDTQVELARCQLREESEKIERKEKEEFEEILKDAAKDEKELKSLVLMKKVTKRLEVKRLPIFTFLDGTPIRQFPYLYGFDYYQFEDGRVMRQPLLTDGKKIVPIRGIFVEKEEDICMDPATYLSQITSGRVLSKVSISNGSPTLLKPLRVELVEEDTRASTIKNSKKRKKKGNNPGNPENEIKQQYVVEPKMMPRDFRPVIAALQHEIAALRHQLASAERRAEKATADSEMYRIHLSASEQRSEIWYGAFRVLMEKSLEQTLQVANALSTFSDVVTDKVIAEDMSRRLKLKLDQLKDKVDKLETKAREEVRSEVFELIERITDITKGVSPEVIASAVVERLTEKKT